MNRYQVSLVGRLYARIKHPWDKNWKDLGLISEAIVTNAFIALLVTELQGTDQPALQTLKYHDTGTGTNSESATDTTLQTPTGEARDVGTQTSTGPGNYRTVATHTYANTFSIREHGVFSASVGGTLLDRSAFIAIPVVNGTQVEYTYDLTLVGS